MTGPGIYSYSTTPANNVQANTGINWDEGMPPAAVNNSARQNMTDMRNAFNDLAWFKYGKGDLDYSPVYASATTFTIAGADLRTPYHIGRRLRAVGASTGTIYGTISAVAFSTDTTVTAIWDSGSLANEALTISLVQVPVTGKPVPVGALSDTPVLRNFLSGLILSAAGATATCGIAAGQAADSTNAAMLTLATAYTKTTGAWAVGTGLGALDTGVIANSTWYYAYLIKRVDTGVTDVLVSLSATAPTMPANYTLKRYIGAMKTDGSAQWVKFSQDGDDFQWDVPVADVTVTNPGIAAVLRTLSVPPGVKVKARFHAGGSNSLTCSAYFSSPDVSDQAANFIGGQVSLIYNSGVIASSQQAVLTNTSGQIRSRFSASDASVGLNIATWGWTDSRGKNA